MQIYIRTVAALAADTLTLVAGGIRTAAALADTAAGSLADWSLR
jgi:hypothetical protein